MNDSKRDLLASLSEGKQTVKSFFPENQKSQFCLISFQIWQAALGTLNPNPTDNCPLYLNLAAVAALPSRVSRHNSPSSAHFVSRLVRSCLPGGSNRCIVVSISIFWSHLLWGGLGSTFSYRTELLFKQRYSLTMFHAGNPFALKSGPSINKTTCVIR